MLFGEVVELYRVESGFGDAFGAVVDGGDGGLADTLRFAGGTTWQKTRRLAEASAHDEDLRALAYQLMDAAGLQRARLTGIALKGEDLIDADQVAQQSTLDQTRESRLVAEEAMDRIRAKFGPFGPTRTSEGGLVGFPVRDVPARPVHCQQPQARPVAGRACGCWQWTRGDVAVSRW
ncbi:hypothetical protein ACFQ9Z_35230 [Streptomyces sp. NPDC056580]|uniref:hypothetical protein n=1 Tax=Streptomyces sp. NPDC056580 TaxID=3345872 RepID=UPI00369953DA